jgi:hypothetical protein
MKLKLKGRVVSTKGTDARIRRIIKVCTTLKRTQSIVKAQMTQFVILMLSEKLRKVGSVSYETAHVIS